MLRGWSFAVFLLTVPIPVEPKPTNSVSRQRRSVSHAQMMHDRSRYLQERDRRLWIQEVLERVHTAHSPHRSQRSFRNVPWAIVHPPRHPNSTKIFPPIFQLDTPTSGSLVRDEQKDLTDDDDDDDDDEEKCEIRVDEASVSAERSQHSLEIQRPDEDKDQDELDFKVWDEKNLSQFVEDFRLSSFSVRDKRHEAEEQIGQTPRPEDNKEEDHDEQEVVQELVKRISKVEWKKRLIANTEDVPNHYKIGKQLGKGGFGSVYKP